MLRLPLRSRDVGLRLGAERGGAPPGRERGDPRRPPLALGRRKSLAFAQDRARAAAYALIPEGERALLHLRLGRGLLHGLPPAEVERRLFEILGQLDRGAALPSTAEEALLLAGLRLRAGKKASAETAFAAALAYFGSGLDALGADRGGDSGRATWLELAQGAAEAACLCGAYDRLAALGSELRARTVDILEEIPLYESEIKAATAQGRLKEAVRIGLEALARLGLRIPEEPSAAEAEAAVESGLAALDRVGIAGIAELPPMTAPLELAAMRILGVIGEPAYLALPRFLVVWAASFARMSLEGGAASVSPFAFAAFALVLCAMGGELAPIGSRLGRVALDLLDAFGAHRVEARVLNIYGCMIQPMTEPLADSLEVLERGVAVARATGDYTSGAFSAFNQCVNAMDSGEPLPALSLRIASKRATVLQFRQGLVADWLRIHQRCLRRLAPAAEETEEDLDIGEWRKRAEASGDRTGLAYFFLNELLALVYLGGSEGMMEALAGLRDNIEAIQGTFGVTLSRFLEALALLRLARSGEGGTIDELVAGAERALAALEAAARLGPANVAHKADIVGAELARLRGDIVHALLLYERGAASASGGGFVHEAGLALELEAGCLEEAGLLEQARWARDRSSEFYERWGAGAKLPSRASRRREGSRPSPRDLAGAGFDEASLLKASRAISSQIEIDGLLSTLMETAIQSAGATRGILVLESGGSEWIEAEGGPGAMRRRIPVQGSGLLPESVVNYVARTNEGIVLDDASTQGPFRRDPYIARTGMLSLLCSPFSALGDIAGMIYLENELVAGAFTPDRVQLIEALASQAAISIKNARYVEELQASAARLKESEERFRALVEQAPDAIVVYDSNTKLFVDANSEAEKLFGCDRARLLASGPEDFYKVEQPDGVDPAQSIAFHDARARAGEMILLERRVLPFSGSREVRDCEVRLSALPAAGRNLVRASFIDVTERKKTERALQAALTEKESLIRELYHRTKNNMQVISALLSSHGAEAGEEVGEAFRDMENRIQSMALVHEMLYASKDLSRVDFADYARRLLDLVASSFGAKSSGIGLAVESEPMALLLDIAVPLGLVINELATNAFKHAFEGRERGVLRVAISRPSASEIEIVVEDDGVGLPRDFDLASSPSLGLQTVEAICRHQLKGSVGFGPRPGGGTVCLVRVTDEGYAKRV